MITFIIPSIGRESLNMTLSSLGNQIDPRWKSIVVFDGISDKKKINKFIKTWQFEKRIEFFESEEKLGIENGSCHSQGGMTRNYAFQFVKTKWIGFVDDDDRLTADYVKCLKEELENDKEVSLVVFRMKFNDGTVLPPIEHINNNMLMKCQVGISFAVKTATLIEENIKFKNNETADYYFIEEFNKKKRSIKLSKKVTYMVG